MQSDGSEGPLLKDIIVRRISAAQFEVVDRTMALKEEQQQQQQQQQRQRQQLQQQKKVPQEEQHQQLKQQLQLQQKELQRQQQQEELQQQQKELQQHQKELKQLQPQHKELQQLQPQHKELQQLQQQQKELQKLQPQHKELQQHQKELKQLQPQHKELQQLQQQQKELQQLQPQHKELQQLQQQHKELQQLQQQQKELQQLQPQQKELQQLQQQQEELQRLQPKALQQLQPKELQLQPQQKELQQQHQQQQEQQREQKTPARKSVIERAPPASVRRPSGGEGEGEGEEVPQKRGKMVEGRATGVILIRDAIMYRIVDILMWKVLGEKQLKSFGYPTAPTAEVLWKVVYRNSCLQEGGKLSECLPQDHDCGGSVHCFASHVYQFLDFYAPNLWRRTGWGKLTCEDVLRRIYYEDLIPYLRGIDLRNSLSVLQCHSDIVLLEKWEKQKFTAVTWSGQKFISQMSLNCPRCPQCRNRHL